MKKHQILIQGKYFLPARSNEYKLMRRKKKKKEKKNFSALPACLDDRERGDDFIEGAQTKCVVNH